MWFQYRQNNTGGVYAEYARKLVEVVLVEAATVEEANAKFPYKLCFGGFGGCGCCGCCGHRWETPWNEEGEAEPVIYGVPYTEYESYNKFAYVQLVYAEGVTEFYPVTTK